MNEMTPPAFTSDLPPQPPVTEPPLAGPALPEPPANLPRLLLSLAVVVVSFDVFLWNTNAAGIGVVLFFLTLIGFILANREGLRWTATMPWLSALTLGAAVAGTWEISFASAIILLTLLTWWAGETFFKDVESPWGRGLSQVVALLRAPGRVFWLAGVILSSAFSGGIGGVGGVLAGCALALPAVVLALIFGTLLSQGNAVFGSWAGSFFEWFWEELALCFDPARIVVWLFVAFLALPLLRPANVSAWWWTWTTRLPQLPEIVPARAAIYSSGLILAVLNFLFFVANLADALFLWSGEALPKGVTYSGYVHEGVNALIATALLSALVLAAIFQQDGKIARSRLLKILGMIWIAQNLFLILSLVLRLKLYIVAYDMTVLRLSVMIFLALVTAGYGLLVLKIVRDKSLSWLVGGCVVAVLATFYVTQFLNLAGWSADYNVARWEKDRTRSLDVAYLETLGSAAWPALAHAHEIDPGNAEVRNVLKVERAGGDYEQAEGGKHWREFSLRAWWNRPALDEATK